jgi:hypothetical protein
VANDAEDICTTKLSTIVAIAIITTSAAIITAAAAVVAAAAAVVAAAAAVVAAVAAAAAACGEHSARTVRGDRDTTTMQFA